MPEPKRTSFTIPLTPEQQSLLAAILSQGNYKPQKVPYTRIAVAGDGFAVNLYTSGKCLVQGKKAEDFVLFTLEPLVLKSATLGYEQHTDTPHLGSDESGKGDFFGPLVVCAAYADAPLAVEMRKIGVRDCKALSDASCLAIATKLENILEPSRRSVVCIGPASYNRLYAKMRSVNRILAWAHARCIEDALKSLPDCHRAVADQFGNENLIKGALMKFGRNIELEQRHKAESDIAVAAASILARARFLRELARMQSDTGVEIPKGASSLVREAGEKLVKAKGPSALLSCCKCHFRTTDQVLQACGFERSVLGPEGAAVSQSTENANWGNKK